MHFGQIFGNLDVFAKCSDKFDFAPLCAIGCKLASKNKAIAA